MAGGRRRHCRAEHEADRYRHYPAAQEAVTSQTVLHATPGGSVEATLAVLVPELATAAEVRQLGFSDELADDRLTMAETGHCRLCH